MQFLQAVVFFQLCGNSLRTNHTLMCNKAVIDASSRNIKNSHTIEKVGCL